MDMHGIPRAHILGYSDGGNVAMCFALKYPERVDKLILNGANLYPAGVIASAQIPIIIQYLQAKREAKKKPGARYEVELLGLMVNDPYIMPWSLRKLTMPTLVIAGEGDLIRERHTKFIARCLPNAQLAILPGGQAVAAMNPDGFNAAVMEFLMQ